MNSVALAKLDSKRLSAFLADPGDTRVVLLHGEDAGLAAAADIFYPRVWLRRPRHVPAGTVSMTVYFHTDAAQLAQVGSGYVLAQARGHS